MDFSLGASKNLLRGPIGFVARRPDPSDLCG